MMFEQTIHKSYCGTPPLRVLQYYGYLHTVVNFTQQCAINDAISHHIDDNTTSDHALLEHGSTLIGYILHGSCLDFQLLSLVPSSCGFVSTKSI